MPDGMWRVVVCNKMEEREREKWKSHEDRYSMAG
jgi:hypothetical protein